MRLKKDSLLMQKRKRADPFVADSILNIVSVFPSEILAAKGKRNMGRLAVAVIVSLWAIPISMLVNSIVPDPYMDEIFHVPQVQQFCKGNFKSWDPMITTPPGLYYLSLAHVASLFPGMFFAKAVSSYFEVCMTSVLRSINGVLAVVCSIIVYEIITHLRHFLGDRKATLHAVVLALYPLHWFFTFLYYTDVASLTAVLAMYLACLKKKYLLSALLGIFAVLIRQTNIIWMLFVACAGIINITLAHKRGKEKVEDSQGSVKKKGRLTPTSSATVGLNLRKRKSHRIVDKDDISTLGTNAYAAAETAGLLDEIQDIILSSWHNKWKILGSFSPFFLALVGFVAFVYWNGSVVLGAKEAHAVSLHFAQIMYFSFVSVLAMAPLQFTLGPAKSLLQYLWKNRLLSLIQGLMAFTVGFISVHYFSIAHPYLLADNRHYPFYLWRKVIKAHCWMKYLLVPVYVYSWFSIFIILGKTQRKIWVLAYFLATAAVLIPAPLIEFRYYTIPFYFLILHSDISENRNWLQMGILYVVLNVFTMTMFLFRPFHWDHEHGIQRFIW